MSVISSCLNSRFQPTRPLRGATTFQIFQRWFRNHFNPRAPCGARLALTACHSRALKNFNPRAPCGARPEEMPPEILAEMISTHAPLAGRDLHRDKQLSERDNFNPRAPCGARLALTACHSRALKNFNPRAPCGARPEEMPPEILAEMISTHAPLAGRDKAGSSWWVNVSISTHAPLAGRDH